MLFSDKRSDPTPPFCRAQNARLGLCLGCPGAAIKRNWLVLGTEGVIAIGPGSYSESDMVGG